MPHKLPKSQQNSFCKWSLLELMSKISVYNNEGIDLIKHSIYFRIYTDGYRVFDKDTK